MEYYVRQLGKIIFSKHNVMVMVMMMVMMIITINIIVIIICFHHVGGGRLCTYKVVQKISN